MIRLDEQIVNLEDDVSFWLSPDGQDPKQLVIAQSILLSLRRLRRIEELMREPSFLIIVAASAEHDDFHKMVAGNAALLKQVEEEVK